MQSVDTSKEPVDGGPGHQAQALRELYRIEATLGANRSALVVDVLGQGMYLPQAASIRGITSERQQRKLTRELYLTRWQRRLDSPRLYTSLVIKVDFPYSTW